MTVEEVALTYRTLIDTDSPEKSYGLNSDEICERRFVYGLNAITPSAKVTYFRQFLGQLLGLFNLLLVTGGALSFVLFAIDPKIQVNLFLGIILVFVAIINAGIDFYQQYRTAALLESFMVSF